MEEYSPVVSASPPPSTPSLPTILELELDHLYAKPLSGGADAASIVHNSNPFGLQQSFKPQLPALSVDRRTLPSGRPGSPFSFGNPPTYPRVSPEGRSAPAGKDSRTWATYDQSAERDLLRDPMDVEQHDPHTRAPPSAFGQHRLTLDPDASAKEQYPDNFDYSMRRHSIATVQSSDPHHVQQEQQHQQGQRSPFHPSLQSVRRKVSHGSIIFGGQTPVETEFPDQYRSPMDPEPKRRGSAFDARGMAQMSLGDRRDSTDSGRFAPPGNWWDRRDSTTSLYSNASAVSSVGGYSSYSGDGKQQPWANAQRTPQPHLPDGLAAPNNGRPFLPDARTPTASAHGPAPYPDRRMSVPDASLAAAGAVRNFRSRSRPPSRGGSGGAQTVTPPHLPQITATLANVNDHYHDPNLGMGHHQTHVSSQPNSALLSTPKEGTTPYSRSPELRVSHKLAERKRRKEMKDLFDELRDHLPADRGMKSSKWEILSKAIDYIAQIQTQQRDMAHEIESLKAEVDALRGGGAAPNNHHSYSGSIGYQQQQTYNATPPQSRTSSHYPAAGPPPPTLG